MGSWSLAPFRGGAESLSPEPWSWMSTLPGVRWILTSSCGPAALQMADWLSLACPKPWQTSLVDHGIIFLNPELQANTTTKLE